MFFLQYFVYIFSLFLIFFYERDRITLYVWCDVVIDASFYHRVKIVILTFKFDDTL